MTKIGFQDQLSLNAGQNFCRMLKGEHSAILLTFIKLPFIIKTLDRFYCINMCSSEEHDGSVVEYLAQDPLVAGSSLT